MDIVWNQLSMTLFMPISHCLSNPLAETLLFAVDSDYYREKQLVTVQRIRASRLLNPKKNICYKSPFKAQKFFRKGQKEYKRQRWSMAIQKYLDTAGQAKKIIFNACKYIIKTCKGKVR